MIVIDASVAIDLLLRQQPQAETFAARLQEAAGIAAPHLLDVEVGQVLRRLVRARAITAPRASIALEALAAMPIDRHAHTGLLRESFRLQGNITFYDAVYLTLAATLEVPLLTRDRSLARLPRRLIDVELIE